MIKSLPNCYTSVHMVGENHSVNYFMIEELHSNRLSQKLINGQCVVVVKHC